LYPFEKNIFDFKLTDKETQKIDSLVTQL